MKKKRLRSAKASSTTPAKSRLSVRSTRKSSLTQVKKRPRSVVPKIDATKSKPTQEKIASGKKKSLTSKPIPVKARKQRVSSQKSAKTPTRKPRTTALGPLAPLTVPE